MLPFLHDIFTVLHAGTSFIHFPMVSMEFSIDIIPPVALRPWGWLSLLTEMSTRKFPEGKDYWCVGLTNLPPLCADCLQIWELQILENLGLSKPIMGLLYVSYYMTVSLRTYIRHPKCSALRASWYDSEIRLQACKTRHQFDFTGSVFWFPARLISKDVGEY